MTPLARGRVTRPTRVMSGNAAALCGFVALIMLYPLLFPGRYPIGAGIQAGAIAVAAVGFVLLIGFAQQLAIGQAAFCMIGGYGSGILCARYGWDPGAALLLSMILAMIAAWVIGKPILKLRGYYLAMASLAFQLLLIFLATESVNFAGGALGITGIPLFSLLGVPLGGDLALYLICWFMVGIAVLVGLNIDRSAIGRNLRAIASSEMAAAAVGIDLERYKTQMLVLSAALASVSGSLTVHYLRVMEPHLFGFQFSLMILTAVIIGGLHSVWGGVLGATAILALREALRLLAIPLWEAIIMGILTVVVLLAFRRGLAGAISTIWPTAKSKPSPNRAAVELRGPVTNPGAQTEVPILQLSGVSKAFGSVRAVSDVSFEVARRSITSLIGPNGAGKTTLLNLISGHLRLDSGVVKLNGHNISGLEAVRVAQLGIGRTFQHVQLFGSMTVSENVMCGRHRTLPVPLYAAVFRTPAARRRESLIRESAHTYLEFVGLRGVSDVDPATLPFGHQRLLEIARALAGEPTLLVMDEPASGLNDEETEALGELILRIKKSGTTILLVEHDVRLVMGISDNVVVLDHGEVIANSPPNLVKRNPTVVKAYLGNA